MGLSPLPRRVLRTATVPFSEIVLLGALTTDAMTTTNLQSQYAIPPELSSFVDDRFLVPVSETVGDCPDFSMPGEKNGTVPFSETVSKQPTGKMLTLAVPGLDYEGVRQIAKTSAGYQR